MESLLDRRPVTAALPRRLRARCDAPALAAWTLAFTLVAYLALRNGGYDTVVRSEVAIAIWWIVLTGALCGILPLRFGRAGWVATGLLAAFAAWTGLAIGWSESAERSAIELARVAAYLGALVLAIAVQGRSAARTTINGVACAIGLVTLLAVLSRLHPSWFPVNDHVEFLGREQARKLSYPLNYWNALAALAAVGAPLILAVAAGARTLAGQAAAAAALPLSALCIFLTLSRGGVLALLVGLVVFLALCPRRVEATATLALCAVGAAILLRGVARRDALLDGAATDAALAQGGEVLALMLLTCAGVGLAQVAIALAARHAHRPALLEPRRDVLARRAAAALCVAALVAVAAGAPSTAADAWREFRAPDGAVTPGATDHVFSRLEAANGNGRYEYWQAAASAGATDRLKGIGPGTFEFYWSRNATVEGFVRDAHSLYLEVLAEGGLVGLVLLGGCLLWLLGTALSRSLREREPVRLWIAAAAGGLCAFLAAAALEWVWEMAALAMTAMLLGAVIVAGREHGIAPVRAAHAARAARAIVAALAVAALVAILIPFAAELAIRESQSAAGRGDLGRALAASRTAERLQPYAATARLQRALVLELDRELPQAAVAARAATAAEPTNWRTWLVLARIEAGRGATARAQRALRQARRLNQSSTLPRAR